MATERVTQKQVSEPNVAAVVRALVDMLSDRLVAMIAGVNSGRTVRQ